MCVGRGLLEKPPLSWLHCLDQWRGPDLARPEQYLLVDVQLRALDHLAVGGGEHAVVHAVQGLPHLGPVRPGPGPHDRDQKPELLTYP